MGKFIIKLVELPADDKTCSARPMEAGAGSKEAFWDNNLSIYCCIAMLLGKQLKEVRIKAPHILLYDRYLGGFQFEGFDRLPPLCILNMISVGIPYNAVFYDGIIYDPKTGIYTVGEFARKNIKVLSYIQIFIETAYEQLDWKPELPPGLQAELENEVVLNTFFRNLPAMQQSKIINFVHPFSKPSSLKTSRASTQMLTPKQRESIISHIRFLYEQQTGGQKSVWDELYEFETVQAVETLKKCGLKEGMTVLDMGCGHGHYSIAASYAAGKSGAVIAVDRQRKVIREAQTRVKALNISNITFLNADETGLADYKNKVDFLLLYDVLHGGEWLKNREEKIGILHSLLKDKGILSLAMYSEIERKPDPYAIPTKEGLIRTIKIAPEEAIRPYLELLESCGFQLHHTVENGGVHFDDFHSAYHWRKYGEVRIGQLERRNIYNFIKL